jgi:hypothetical protein
MNRECRLEAAIPAPSLTAVDRKPPWQTALQEPLPLEWIEVKHGIDAARHRNGGGDRTITHMSFATLRRTILHSSKAANASSFAATYQIAP